MPIANSTSEWSAPVPGPYEGTHEITREGPWCTECNRKHTDVIRRTQEGPNMIYSRSIGPHWIGHFKSAEEAKAYDHQ